ncbi:MAG: recombination mediator RecR [Alphaproteobacteria bacterium]|nr:recombination mediator RecR [Alphaproteobacteria bacterium]
MMTTSLDHLIYVLGKLPGLGPRSARRVALTLLQKKHQVMEPLMSALQDVHRDVKSCSLCGNWDVCDPCAICESPLRDSSVLCVVEDVADLWALERSRAFKGLYHVLGGTLSALDGVRPSDLRLDSLIKRVETQQVAEVILALGATVEGQTTAHYVIEKLENLPLKLTRLAHGLPVGGELDYLDDGTLTAALLARRAAC